MIWAFPKINKSKNRSIFYANIINTDKNLTDLIIKKSFDAIYRGNEKLIFIFM